MNMIHTKITNVLIVLLIFSIWVLAYGYLKFQIDVENRQAKRTNQQISTVQNIDQPIIDYSSDISSHPDFVKSEKIIR